MTNSRYLSCQKEVPDGMILENDVQGKEQARRKQHKTLPCKFFTICAVISSTDKLSAKIGYSLHWPTRHTFSLPVLIMLVLLFPWPPIWTSPSFSLHDHHYVHCHWRHLFLVVGQPLIFLAWINLLFDHYHLYSPPFICLLFGCLYLGHHACFHHVGFLLPQPFPSPPPPHLPCVSENSFLVSVSRLIGQHHPNPEHPLALAKNIMVLYWGNFHIQVVHCTQLVPVCFGSHQRFVARFEQACGLVNVICFFQAAPSSVQKAGIRDLTSSPILL